MATDDKKLIQVCQKLGIETETPIDDKIRQHMALWEKANLPDKGLPRVLLHIFNWLQKHNYKQVAENFWSNTGEGSHLP